MDLQQNETGVKSKKIKVRAYSPSQILKKQRTLYPFEGKWKESFGQPEKHAKWFFTGPSYSGKSSLIFHLANYLTSFGVVDYNNFEEAGGDSETVADKLRMFGLGDKDGKLRLYKAPIISNTHETFAERLLKRNSAVFGIIDSVQHAGLNKASYIDLTDKLSNSKKGKSLVFINHWVKDDITKFIKHDCDIKVEVINFVARVESRYPGGNKPMVIWEDKAKQLWGKRYKQVIDGRYWPGLKK